MQSAVGPGTQAWRARHGFWQERASKKNYEIVKKRQNAGTMLSAEH